MPNLGEHQSAKLTKLLFIGDSGSGKTGALVSLVPEYNLHILDFDNGLDSLAILVKQKYPDRLNSIEFHTLRDKYSATAAGVMVQGMPNAFIDGMKKLHEWSGAVAGKPGLGEKDVIVIDSLTMLSDAAFNWATAVNPSAKDKRQIYGAAQDAVENALNLLTSEALRTNVIVTAHVKFIETGAGMKGYPTSVGTALSPKIPAYFNHYALCENVAGKRTLRLTSNGLVDVKSPVSFRMAPALPIETGLADFFREVRK